MPIPHLLSRFRPAKESAPSAPPSYITEADDSKWHDAGEAQNILLEELTKLYWIGIETELESVLVALRHWQKKNQPDLEEVDTFIHGFDTFIDQVSDDGRVFADKVGSLQDRTNKDGLANHLNTLTTNAEISIAAYRKTELKKEIRSAVAEYVPHESNAYRRARLLLQSLGLLDIEKLIEHRSPLKSYSFWKRPSVPQLKLFTVAQDTMPILKPRLCDGKCGMAISGSMYRRINPSTSKEQESAQYLCEDCYAKLVLGKQDSDNFAKLYKHCILKEVVNSRYSRKICRCDDVPHYDTHGKSMSLFPVDKTHNHRKANAPGAVECGLLKLGELVAEAKYEGMQTILNKTESNKKEPVGKKDDSTKAMRMKSTGRPKTVTTQSQEAPDREKTTATAVAFEEAKADEDVPLLYRQFAEQYPFGNVHMALRLGPLVIENGVKNTKDGALISLRNPPNIQSIIRREKLKALAVDGGKIQHVWSQDRPPAGPKRLKCIMKQVIGTPFTEMTRSSLEDRIIDNLLQGSKHDFDDEGLSNEDRSKWVHNILAPCIILLKDLLNHQLSVYLKSITAKLLDPKTKLTWSVFGNNCQNFCDSILDRQLFGPLVPEPSPKNSPLYLMSFVCRTEGYAKPKIKTKFDVPNGLTEEYLLRFHYGRHDDADIIDTLQEYWYDWGAFGKHLYPNQDLFPWDCTEAFGRYPTTCGECSLSKHLWAFPFDSWSITSLHLTRDRHHYPPISDTQHGIMSDAEWMKNRMRVIMAQEILTIVAVAMARSQSFRDHTAWLHQQSNESVLDRVKLGGIHRAQPFSHYYDQGKYQHYFIASWAHLTLQDQIAEYELLRDGRVRLPDVEYAPRLYKGESLKDILKGVAMLGVGGGAGFAAGALGDGGNAGNCGSGCGSAACAAGDSGCASSGYSGAGYGGGGDSGGGGGGGGGGCGGGCGGG